MYCLSGSFHAKCSENRLKTYKMIHARPVLLASVEWGLDFYVSHIFTINTITHQKPIQFNTVCHLSSLQHILQHHTASLIVVDSCCCFYNLLKCSSSWPLASWSLWPQVTDSVEVNVLSSHQQRTSIGTRYKREKHVL